MSEMRYNWNEELMTDHTTTTFDYIPVSNSTVDRNTLHTYLYGVGSRLIQGNMPNLIYIYMYVHTVYEYDERSTQVHNTKIS